MTSTQVDDDIVQQACKLCQDFEYRGRFYGIEETRSATTAKVFAIIAILAMTVLGIFIRLKFPTFAYSKASSFLSVFSGGMFVSLGLFFLVPTAAIQYPEGIFGSVPWIFVSCMGGFLAVLLNERVIFNTQAATVTQQICVVDDDQEMVEYTEKSKGGEFQNAPEDPPSNGWGVLLLVLALAIQSIFEGSIVTTAHTVGSVWLATFMVSLHRLASAFSLAARLEDQRIRRRISICLLILFSLSTPLGAVIGWLIEAFSNGGSTLPLFNAFAAGTLLYFGFSECIAEEFSQRKGRYWRFLLFSGGIGLVLLLTWVHNEQELDLSADHAFMTFCKVSHQRCDGKLQDATASIPPPSEPLTQPPKDASDDTAIPPQVQQTSDSETPAASHGEAVPQVEQTPTIDMPQAGPHDKGLDAFMKQFQNLPPQAQDQFANNVPDGAFKQQLQEVQKTADAKRLLSPVAI